MGFWMYIIMKVRETKTHLIANQSMYIPTWLLWKTQNGTSNDFFSSMVAFFSGQVWTNTWAMDLSTSSRVIMSPAAAWLTASQFRWIAKPWQVCSCVKLIFKICDVVLGPSPAGNFYATLSMTWLVCWFIMNSSKLLEVYRTAAFILRINYLLIKLHTKAIFDLDMSSIRGKMSTNALTQIFFL